jgi:hypothetical protein
MAFLVEQSSEMTRAISPAFRGGKGMAFKSPETSNVGNGVGRPSLDREDMFRRACSKSLSSNEIRIIPFILEHLFYPL